MSLTIRNAPSSELQTIADYFIALSNETQNLITNLKLQKLVYYVQAWHLAVYNKPAFEDKFEAWVHGPVVPALYRKYKKMTYHPIIEEKPDSESIMSSFGDELKLILQDVVEGYFGRTAYELEQLTHTEDPWVIARKDVPVAESSTAIIELQAMRQYYGQFVL